MDMRLTGLPNAIWALVLIGISAVYQVQLTAAEPHAVSDSTPPARCVVVEMFVDQSRELDQQVEASIAEIVRQRGGILLAVRKLQAGENGSKRLAQITSHFKIDAGDRPLIYCMNQAIHGLATEVDYQRAFTQSLRLEVFVRSGCSRCAAMERFLPGYLLEYPALQLLLRDIGRDARALDALNQLVTKHRRAASSVPVLHVCDGLQIGFASEAASRSQLDAILHRWTKTCPEQPATTDQSASEPHGLAAGAPLLATRSASPQQLSEAIAVLGVAAPVPFSVP